ncbi:MAG: ABC transporter permease [Gemmatimonadetes bacterium]|nr:ABC transporter permease [Gemmatimonadota bacterium]
MNPPRPPILPRILLALLLRREEREVISGDLEEEFQALVSQSGGGSAARAWYRRQAWKAVGGRTVERFRRVAGSGGASTERGDPGPSGVAGPDGAGGGTMTMVRELLRDVRFGVRTFRRQPGFAAVAALTLALGVGATTAVFSIVDGVVLRPLAYPHADRIMQVWSGHPLSKSTLASIRDRVSAFETVSGYQGARFALTGEGPAAEIVGAAVAPGYFDVIGVRPARGRAFSPEESKPGHDGVAILSHAMWVGRFGSAPDVVGRSIRVDGSARTVVGIMPAGYRSLDPAWQIWVPQTVDPTNFSDWKGTAGTRVIARMAPEATAEQADAELAPIAQELHEANADAFDDAFVAAGTVTPLQQATVGSFSRTLWILFGAVSFVLLIACANVANLLLARGESRSQELAVRRSIGATAGRLIRQLLAEGMLLAVAGGGLGCGLAWLAIWTFREHVPTALPLGDRVALNGSVLGFAVATSLLTVALFALWPAVRALRPDLREALQSAGHRGGRRSGERRVNRILMAFEVALSLVLLTGAGLLIKSSWLLQHVDPGFRVDHLLTMRVSLPGGRYEDEATRVSYFRDIEERVGAIPGVVGVGSMSHLPLTSGYMSTLFTVVGRPPREGEARSYAMVQSAMPGLGETLGTRLLHGRFLEASDREDAPRVTVINRALATRAFGNDDPLGKKIELFGWFEATVVGVVKDVRDAGLDRVAPPEAILAYPQLSGFSSMYVVVRTKGDPGALRQPVVAAISELDRDVPITRVTTMEDFLRSSISDSRLTTAVFTLFAAVALLLSMVGVYGVLSYTVSERTYEIGVRVAMGAGRGTVVREIIRESVAPVGLGVVVGWGAAMALSRVMASLLFEVHPRDPVVLGTVTLGLVLAAAAAVVIPARRAASVDPVRCLDG